MPGFVDMWLRTQSIANKNRAGTRMQPCFTPEVAWNRLDRLLPLRTWAPVFSCRAAMRSVRKSGAPVLRSAFHKARRRRSRRLLWCLSKRGSVSGQIHGEVQIRDVEQGWRQSWIDLRWSLTAWWSLRVLSRSGWIRAKRMWANTLPGTERSVIGR